MELILNPHIVCRSWLIITGSNIRSTSELAIQACIYRKESISCRTIRRSYRRGGTAPACRHGLVAWVAAERGAYVMIPWRSVRHVDKCRPLEQFSCLEYIIHWRAEFGCGHTCNISSGNERERPRSNHSLPSQHFHPAGRLMARLCLSAVHTFAARQSNLLRGCLCHYCNGA
jgi:hypothetical protein